MSKILITYAGRRSSTIELAFRMASELRASGQRVTVLPADRADDASDPNYTATGGTARPWTTSNTKPPTSPNGPRSCSKTWKAPTTREHQATFGARLTRSAPACPNPSERT